MTIEGPLFSFFGSKWRLAPFYPTPVHRTLIEPFAGSACYATRYHTRDVVLVERDPVVASVWRFLLQATRLDVLELPDLEPEQDVASLRIPDGAKALIGFWLNAAHTHPARRPSRWMRIYSPGGESDNGSLFWSERVRERIADALPKIRHWTLIEGDYSSAPDVRATWFVDPPYSVSRNARYSGRASPDLRPVGDRYRCKASNIDFEKLGAWCREREGQTIVCEGQGATWLPFRRFSRSARMVPARPGVKPVGEAVWIAGDGQLALDGVAER